MEWFFSEICGIQLFMLVGRAWKKELSKKPLKLSYPMVKNQKVFLFFVPHLFEFVVMR
jgi:hypothetical protein